MLANSREEVVEAFDALGAAMDRVLGLDASGLTTPEQLSMLARCEVLRCQLPAVEHPMIEQIAYHATPVELGDTARRALAERLHITAGEAQRRIDEAAVLGPRQSMTGEILAPWWPATAAAQRDGRIGAAHLRIVRDFFNHLPNAISHTTRAEAETTLAGYASEHRPDELAGFANQCFDELVPDGLFDDTERARRRGVSLGRQDRDGMSKISGYLTPEARAGFDAVLARWAAPGMCNPADEAPCVAGTPSQEAIQGDRRGACQRNHDALLAMIRNLLASGDLGQHNGLPATIIVSASLADLEAGTGKAHTGGGTWLPMTDVIRLASHAHHYLRIFGKSKELALFHTRRLASPAQRIVLYARDRGCVHPGCGVPGYLCEVDHAPPYAQTGHTHIDELGLRCGGHHELLTSGGWKTRTRANGDIETIPPPHLDHGQPRRNFYHHPEKLLRPSEDDDDPEDP